MSSVLAFVRALSLCLVLGGFSSALFSQSLHDARSYPGPGVAALGPMSGDVLQGPVPHFGLDPLGICFDPAGAVHAVPTLYVVDLYDGLTFLYDATDLSLIESIASPAGVTVVSGITTDGSALYWVADETLYSTAMDGTGLVTLGALNLPGGGLAGDCCLDGNGDLWVVDITSDQYSRHSVVDGSYLGDTFANPSGVDAFGTGIAVRSDCGFFEVPHGAFVDGQVTTLSVTTGNGPVLDSVPFAQLGAFVSGVATATTSPTFGVYSLFVVEAATGTILEVEGLDPCPVPQPDCHANPSESSIYAFTAPTVTFETTPSFPVSSVFPTTFSSLSVSGLSTLIEDLDCRVDVAHTFVGDLDVELESPAGTTVQLHDSAGSSANDLDATFDDDGRPYGPPFGTGDTMRPSGPGDLADFDGEDGNGIWTLMVTDNFDGEDGTLDSWSIELPTGLAIPDDDPAGVVATITVDPSVLDAVNDLDVNLDVEHADPTQLTIELTSPTGTTVVLHDQTGVGPGLIERYDDDSLLGGQNDGFGTAFPSGPGTLGDFDFEAVAGDWTLTLMDTTAGTVGQLRSWELLVCRVPCTPPFDLTCTSDCQTGEVSLDWTNAFTHAAIEIRRDGTLIGTRLGDATSFVDTPPAGVYEYTLTAICDPAAASTPCTVIHAPYTDETHIVYAGELPAGAIDSAGALVAALDANSANPLLIDDLAYPCLDQLPVGATVWVTLGTFPDNHVLDPTEGQLLADLVANGISVYVEGGDSWGFDDPTPFAAFDGVEDATAEDGDDSFAGMVGLAHASLDLSDLTATYDPDQPITSDFTDRLLATGTTPGEPIDIPAGTAGIVWQQDTLLYGTGVYFETDATFGRVIAQSWEFGGYGEDQNELASRYLSVFDPSSPDPEFIRGDANQDLSVEISDAVFVLNYLFIPGSDDPPCFSSADVNDDGSVQISDGVFLLNYLFTAGDDPPPPFPNCGVDPTTDALPCDVTDC